MLMILENSMNVLEMVVSYSMNILENSEHIFFSETFILKMSEIFKE